MIKDLLADEFESNSVYPDTMFSAAFDYEAAAAKNRAAKERWGALDKTNQAEFSNQLHRYLDSEGAADLKDLPESNQVRNLYRLQNEIKAQIDSEQSFRVLGIEPFNADQSLIQLLEHLENSTYIRKLYRLRKLTTGRDNKSGISEEQARILRNCIRQGRDLFISGQNGSLMIKPLVWFYSLTAYAYACIILNSPVRYSLETLPGSHGLNYLPEQIKTQFGGPVKAGTFSELFLSFPIIRVQNTRLSFVQSMEDSIRAFQTTRVTSSCGTLLSLLPEMRNFYSLLTGRPSRVHPLDVTQIPEGRGIKWEFQIGDGQQRPDPAIFERAFAGFPKSERQGRMIISVSPGELYKVKAAIYTDLKGRFWYVDNPFFPVILPELCVHFLLANAFSSIMRYRPGPWGDILLNEVESDIALLVRNYFSTFETKVPILLLRHLSEFSPYIDSEA